MHQLDECQRLDGLCKGKNFWILAVPPVALEIDGGSRLTFVMINCMYNTYGPTDGLRQTNAYLVPGDICCCQSIIQFPYGTSQAFGKVEVIPPDQIIEMVGSQGVPYRRHDGTPS